MHSKAIKLPNLDDEHTSRFQVLLSARLEI